MSERHRRPLCLYLLILGLASICLAKDTWLEVRSPSFVIVGNASEGTIRKVGTELEQFRAAVRALWPETSNNATKPVVVIAFKDDASFTPFRPAGTRASDIAGYFLGAEDISYICLNPGAHRRLDSIVFHEYVHELLHGMFWSIPAWANEGLAEYYCTFDAVDGEQKAVIGKAIAEHLRFLRRASLMPLGEFLRAEPAAFMTQSGRERNLHYAQAWLLVHYLMHGNIGAYREKLIRFLKAGQQESLDPDKRFQAEFGSDYRAIEKDLLRYARQASFSTEIRDLSGKPGSESPLTIRPLTAAAVAAHLGTLLLYSDRDPEAEPYLLRAIASEPANGDARTSLGILYFRQKRLDEASRHLDQAVSIPNVRPVAHYYHVRTMMTTVGGGVLISEGDTAKKEFVIRHLRKVLEGFPGHADSCHLLAYVNLFYGEQLEESVALAKRAVALAPDQKSYVLTLAQLYIRRQEFEAADSILRPLLQAQDDPSIRLLASDVEAELNRAKANAAASPK